MSAFDGIALVVKDFVKLVSSLTMKPYPYLCRCKHWFERKNTTKLWKKKTEKKLSKTPMPGCKSWRKKLEHWFLQFLLILLIFAFFCKYSMDKKWYFLTCKGKNIRITRILIQTNIFRIIRNNFFYHTTGWTILSIFKNFYNFFNFCLLLAQRHYV